MEKCPFCNIVKDKNDIIYTDSFCTAFLDYDPINEGHILLVTNQHLLDLDNLSDSLLTHLFTIAKKIIVILKKAYPQMDGYTIMQNGGKFNDLNHFHLHIFPRYFHDGFSWNYGDDKAMDLKDIKEKLLSFINEM